MANGYEQIYEGLLPKLMECDLAESAQRLGLVYTGGEARIRFLQREYSISTEGAVPLDGQPVGINNRSVLLYYILSSGAGEPTHDYAPLFRLTGAIAGRNDQNTNLMDESLLRAFRNDYAGFVTAATLLGGICLASEDTGKHV